MSLPSTIGPYRLTEPLGRRGHLFRAVPEAGGPPVVLKMLSVPDAAFRPRIRRTIQAVADLRNPGVVRILDQGQQDELLWYAMESLEGPSLREWLASAPSLQERLTLIRRLSATLASLHGEGLVHRCLGAEHVLVRPSGFPVLIGFGLGPDRLRPSDWLQAAPHDLEAVAPEQIRGEPVDARADLYALGCLLYFAVTGHPPFQADNPEEVLRQHLEAPLDRDGLWGPNFDAVLTFLVARLMVKQPAGRLAYASQADAMLRHLGARNGNSAPARPYLYQAPFTGRQPVLETLRSRFSELQQGRGGFVFVEGAEGLGKTRLATELERIAGSQGIRVLRGDCPASGGQALEAFRKPLLELARYGQQHGSLVTDWLLGRRGPVLALYQPLLGKLQGQETQLRPAELPPQEARLRLFADLAETWEALAEEQPLLLLLDDLQFADELSLGFLEHLCRTASLASLPFLIVGFVRVGAQPLPRLEGILSTPGVQRISLPRMSSASMEALSAGVLGQGTSPSVGARAMALACGGNPMVLVESLQCAVRDGQLLQGEWGEWSFPEQGDLRIIDLARPVGDFSQDLQPVLRAASVLGSEFEERILLRMLARESNPGHGVSALLRDGVLQQSGPGLLRFTREALRLLLEESLSETQRVELHKAAAESIEALLPEDENLGILARHWHLAGESQKSRVFAWSGARQARDQHAYFESEALYRLIFEGLPEIHLEGIEARLELGQTVCQPQGQQAEALALLEAAVEGARCSGHPPILEVALRGLGRILSRTTKQDRARNCFAEALDICRQQGDRNGEAKNLQGLGSLLMGQGALQEARAYFKLGLTLAAETGDKHSEGIALGNLATLAQESGRLEESQALQLQALAIHRERGDRESECRTLNNLAIAKRARGKYAEALELYEQALTLARQMGHRRLEGILLGNRGLLEQMLGRLSQARTHYGEALVLGQTTGDVSSLAIVLGNLAALHTACGELPEASRCIEEAVRYGEQSGNARLEGVLLITRATVARQGGGNLDEAEQSLLRARELLHPLQASFELASSWVEQAHLELARGQSGAEAAQTAEDLAAGMEFGPDSELGILLARLRRALRVAAAGQSDQLVRGECLEDLPDGLRRSLSLDP